MKEDLVLIEAFSIIFNKVILTMNVNRVYLILLLITYLHGNQQVLLVILMIVI